HQHEDGRCFSSGHEVLSAVSWRERVRAGPLCDVSPVPQSQPGEGAHATSWLGVSAMMAAYGATHPGRQRPNNEDAFFIAVPLGAAILADGMGGQNCGEVGSAITIQTV